MTDKAVYLRNIDAVRLNDAVESNLRALRETEKALAQLALMTQDAAKGKRRSKP